MHHKNWKPLLMPVLAVTAMLIMMGVNTAVSVACRGHAWSVFAVAPLSIGQAALLIFALMDLPEAGPVPRVYLGMALILLAVAALSCADYATRQGAWDDPPGQEAPAGKSGELP